MAVKRPKPGAGVRCTKQGGTVRISLSKGYFVAAKRRRRSTAASIQPTTWWFDVPSGTGKYPSGWSKDYQPINWLASRSDTVVNQVMRETQEICAKRLRDPTIIRKVGALVNLTYAKVKAAKRAKVKSATAGLAAYTKPNKWGFSFRRGQCVERLGSPGGWTAGCHYVRLRHPGRGKRVALASLNCGGTTVVININDLRPCQGRG